MPIPEYALQDMLLSQQGAKRKSGVVFCLIPHKNAEQPPWLIIGKAADVQKRFLAARKAIRSDTDKPFRLSKLITGALQRDKSKRMVFVADEEPKVPKIAEKLKSKWPQKLKESKDLVKLAALLRRAVFTTKEGLQDVQADLATQGEANYDAGEDVDGLGLSKAELEEFFGDDADDVEDFATTLAGTPFPNLSDLEARLDPRAAALARQEIESVWQQASQLLTEAGPAVAAIMALLRSDTLRADAKKKSVGTPVDVATKIQLVMPRLRALIHTRDTWQRALLQVEFLRDELADLRAGASFEGESVEDLELQWTVATLHAEQAKQIAERAVRELEGSLHV